MIVHGDQSGHVSHVPAFSCILLVQEWHFHFYASIFMQHYIVYARAHMHVDTCMCSRSVFLCVCILLHKNGAHTRTHTEIGIFFHTIAA
jgi:hypothetical protein